MAQTLPKAAGVELNHETKVFINTTPTAESVTYKSMCNAFTNVALALNEVVHSASFLSDGGYSSSTVTGFVPTVTLQGEFIASDPVCAYLDKIQWSPGAARVTDIKMNRNGQIITCPVTLTQIAIAGELRRNLADITSAEQSLKKAANDRDHSTAYEQYGKAVRGVFAVCFGAENAEAICKFFEGNYVEMSVAIVPYIYEVILPRVNECIARRREQLKGIYRRGKKLR